MTHVGSVALAARLNCAVLQDLFHEEDRSHAAAVGARESPKISILVRPLLQLGYQIHLVTLSPEVSAPFCISGPRITLTVCPSRPEGRTRDLYAKERQAVRDAVLSRPVDVVHAHQTYEYALGALATRLPTLVSVRDWALTVARLERQGFRSPSRAAHLLAKTGMQMATLVRGRHFTANSPYLAQRVQRVVRTVVPIVPNCLPDEVISDRSRALSSGDPTIVSVNRGFSALKNVGTLLAAFATVRRRFPGARLVLVGPDYQPDGPAESWSRTHGLASGVEFLGPLLPAQVYEALDRADLLAHASREESFGIVLMEAMARGTPVIGGRRSGAVPWVLAGGKAGRLTDVEDPQRFGAAIQHMLEDHEGWKALSLAGRENVRTRFSVGAVTARYAEQYGRVFEAAQLP